MTDGVAPAAGWRAGLLRARRVFGARVSLRAAIAYPAGVAVLLVVWQAAAGRYRNPVVLPTPGEVLSALLDLAADGEIAAQTAASAWRLLVAFVLGSALGVAFGFAVGLSRHARALIDPLIELLRPISGIAWIPLALYLFGIGNALPIFIIAYVVFFPVVLNTAGGVRATDKVLVRAARTMGVGRRRILRYVILPGSLPSILTGVRLGATNAWLALIAAELVGAPAGLGFAIQWYGGILETPSMLAMIVVVSVMGLLTDVGFRLLQRRLTPWAAGLTVAS
jgi:ABC-type nitrate/sulfonate/bicarbonate transport system permease component